MPIDFLLPNGGGGELSASSVVAERRKHVRIYVHVVVTGCITLANMGLR